MNTLKFRAWHKELKHMDYVDELIWRDSKLAIITCSNIGFGFDVNEVELMQFTGLIDRNNKEIFEGDIINPMPQHADTALVYVKWIPEKATFELLQATGKYKDISSVWVFNQFAMDYYEVKGNVYENMELINAPEI